MSLLILFGSAGAAPGEAYAGVATATGAAAASSESVGQPASLATSTGSAYGVTFSVGYTLGVATATGSAYGTSASIGQATGVATSTGSAWAASDGIGQPAGAATSTGSALAASTSIEQPTGVATATGEAYGASQSVEQTTGVATATGSALDATAQTASGAVPVWTAPANGVNMSASPDLTFTIPAIGDGIHFWLELDTAATFDTGNLRTYRSDNDQTGWDYWTGGAWADVPAGGVGSAYAGNDARLSVPTPLSTTTWYRRVKAGV